jgi:hypothetical protein
MGNTTAVQWLKEPEDQDFPAAQSYLGLIYEPSACDQIVRKLRAAETALFKAKDIFRASRLSLLGISNSHVENDRGKIASGKALSPLLLVRDSANGTVIVADGYHRLCAVYSFDEDAMIPCKIV